MNAEQKILTRPGKWTFDEEVSRIFDDHVRKSIPCYQNIQEMIGILSREILPNKAVVYDLGTASGEVIKSIHLANPDKQITYHGIDNSFWMLQRGKEKCKEINNVHFYHADVESFSYLPSDLTVAAFTLQFIPEEPRQHVLKKIKYALKKEGHLILCEKIHFSSRYYNHLFKAMHEKWKTKYFTKTEVLAKKKSLKNVMHPFTLEENIHALKIAGFNTIYPFFQWGNFICILAK